MTDSPLDPEAIAPVRGRIEVPPDPRDLPGEFGHRLEVSVRFGDTDAMGHANNARFLTYCESARFAYVYAVALHDTGAPAKAIRALADEVEARLISARTIHRTEAA